MTAIFLYVLAQDCSGKYLYTQSMKADQVVTSTLCMFSRELNSVGNFNILRKHIGSRPCTDA